MSSPIIAQLTTSHTTKCCFPYFRFTWTHRNYKSAFKYGSFDEMLPFILQIHLDSQKLIKLSKRENILHIHFDSQKLILSKRETDEHPWQYKLVFRCVETFYVVSLKTTHYVNILPGGTLLPSKKRTVFQHPNIGRQIDYPKRPTRVPNVRQHTVVLSTKHARPTRVSNVRRHVHTAALSTKHARVLDGCAFQHFNICVDAQRTATH